MSPALIRRGLVHSGAVVLGAAVAGIPVSVRAGAASAPVTFDAEAFVDDLLAAGCHVAVHQPTGRGDGAAYWIVYPADFDGTPTEGERDVRARWAASMATCSGADARILAVCRRRAELHRQERVRRLGEVAS